MVLNHDCVRDILFEIERFSKFGKAYYYDPNKLRDDSFLSKYDCDAVLYHARQCSLAGYLLNCNWKISDYVYIEDLTPLGHDLIGNIRSEEKWSRTRNIISKLGGAGLKMLSATAEGVARAFLDKYVDEIAHSL